MASKRLHLDTFPDLLQASPSQTTPLLLELARLQASRRRPADLLTQLERDGFVQPSPLDQRLVHRLDGLALDAASEFEAVHLSPVAPLGVCSALAPTSQDRTLSAQRTTEVVSDPTNLLALLCAQRLRPPGVDTAGAVRLCTAHQVLRAQALPPEPGFTRHFRLFVLAEAGYGAPEDGFELDAIARHLRVFDRLFDTATQRLGLHFPDRKFVLRTTDRRAALRDRLHTRLTRDFPHVALTTAPLDTHYYDGLRLMFGARAASGSFVPVADLGLFDWVARLTSNRRHRFVASGIGIQLFPLLFGAPRASS